jgi:hypothetical protein
MQCCGIDACETHYGCTGFSRSVPGFCPCDLTQPCNIKLDGGVLVIDSNKVTFLNGMCNLYLYEVTYPFTREELMCLNDIDSQEPDAYVRALKKQKRSQCTQMPKRSDTTQYRPPGIVFREQCQRICEEQALREELTKLKELTRRQSLLLEVKDREIIWLKAKLNL